MLSFFFYKFHLIIVAEGAIDRQGRAISCEMIRQVVVDGAEAVMALMAATPETEPYVISLDGNTAVQIPLTSRVEILIM